MSAKIWFMNAWNVGDALQNPKNMTVGSKSPMGVMKAAFHWSSSQMQILLYPQRMSNLVNKVDSLISSMSSGMRGSG